MSEMLLGAFAMASAVAGLFFIVFWRRTGDRFFLLFALAFWADTIVRIYIGATGTLREDTPGVYLIRLLGYTLILIAVIDKNRPRHKN